MVDSWLSEPCCCVPLPSEPVPSPAGVSDDVPDPPGSADVLCTVSLLVCSDDVLPVLLVLTVLLLLLLALLLLLLLLLPFLLSLFSLFELSLPEPAFPIDDTEPPRIFVAPLLAISAIDDN